MDTLLLNANYLPLGVISWQKAMKLLFKEKVQIVEEYDDRLINGIFRIPAIVRLCNIVSIKTQMKFSRDNVFLRDKYMCQYCSSKKELTLDHVMPRSRGGKTTFENIVTSCMPCNTGKANRTPEEAGLLLKRKPARLPYVFYAMSYAASKMSHQSWGDYTGPFHE